jgi:molybdopterin molybdotransferase
MLSVSDARERILNTIKVVDEVILPIDQVVGRVLAENVTSPTDYPTFDNSSMDGFAVRSSDIACASQTAPTILTVVSDIRAGMDPGIPLFTGQCARIMTGAPVPSGSDAVVMVEDTDFEVRIPGSPAPNVVAVFKPTKPGENVRHRADDVHVGEKVLPAGTRLRAQDVGLLAMLGRQSVPVYRRTRVAILSSGDELLSINSPLVPGKIYDANSYLLAAMLEKTGIDLVNLGIAADSEMDIRLRLDNAVKAKVDFIISSAGVSVGASDYIKAVIEERGNLDFWKVNMRPGKPLAYGKYRGIPFFGLPGNPVSAFVSFEVFVRPALEKASGQVPHLIPTQKAILAQPIESDGRETYFRAVVSEEGDHLVAHLSGHQGSGNLFSLVQANALLIVPSGVKSLPANSEVQIWPIL